MQEDTPRYNMKAAVRRTGLTPYAIRAWERRYKAVEPYRTDTNRRMYSDTDVERLRLLRMATQEGHTISQIAHLGKEELRALIGPEAMPESEPSAPAPRKSAVNLDTELIQKLLDQCKDAAESLDMLELERVLLEARVNLSVPVLLEAIVGPLLTWVGDSWRDGVTRVAHEHLTTAVMRRFLNEMRPMGADYPSGAPTIVIATPPGQMHELGALMVSIIANETGWRDAYLGVNTPIEDIVHTARELDAKVVALSLVFPADDAALVNHLRRLVRLLPHHTRILIGGGSALAYEQELADDRVQAVTSLSKLRDELE